MLARSGLVVTKILLATFGAIPGHFVPWTGKMQTNIKISYFPWRSGYLDQEGFHVDPGSDPQLGAIEHAGKGVAKIRGDVVIFEDDTVAQVREIGGLAQHQG